MNTKDLTAAKGKRPRIKRYQHQEWTPGQLAIMQEDRLLREALMHGAANDPAIEKEHG